MTDERLALRIPEVATALGVSPSTVKRLIRAGRIRVVRPSPGTVRVEPREVQAYLAHIRRVA